MVALGKYVALTAGGSRVTAELPHWMAASQSAEQLATVEPYAVTRWLVKTEVVYGQSYCVIN